MQRRMLRVVGMVLVIGAGVTAVANGQSAVGAVYTMSNARSGNQILLFDRHVDGTLTPAGAIATGGAGTGGGLGNQSGLVLSDDGESLLAVNAGSNDISIFDVHED